MTPNPVSRARQSIREASYANSRAIAVVDFVRVVNVLLREIVDGGDDISEVILKVRGIEEQGTQLIERLTDILREQTVDDREVSVPPTDMTWVR